MREALAGIATQSFGQLAVDRLVLMRSDLGSGGARYRELASAPLSG